MNNLKNIIVRYGEIGTKSRGTRKNFELKLKENIKSLLKLHNIYCEVILLHTRLLVTVKEENLNKTIDLLKKVAGIVSFSPVETCNLELEQIEKLAIKVFENEINNNIDKYNNKEYITFAVKTQRIKKNFKMNSMELSSYIGAVLSNYINNKDNNINLKVDLKNPDILLNIELIDECLIFIGKIKGIGGLPTGTQGKVVVLFSDGIDSVVASYYMIRRGCNVILLHMAMSETTINKANKLYNVLKDYDPKAELIIYNYKEILKNVVLNLKEINREKYICIFCKRTMLKIAEQYAKENNCYGIVMGDNLGQVASQTLKNMFVISSGVEIPILRPLIGFDKQEIINKAIEIGTYEISISEEGKCFALPKNPITNSDIREINYIEKLLNEKKDN